MKTVRETMRDTLQSKGFKAMVDNGNLLERTYEKARGLTVRVLLLQDAPQVAVCYIAGRTTRNKIYKTGRLALRGIESTLQARGCMF